MSKKIFAKEEKFAFYPRIKKLKNIKMPTKLVGSKNYSTYNGVKVGFWGGSSIDPVDALARANLEGDIESVRRAYGTDVISDVKITGCDNPSEVLHKRLD